MKAISTLDESNRHGIVAVGYSVIRFLPALLYSLKLVVSSTLNGPVLLDKTTSHFCCPLLLPLTASSLLAACAEIGASPLFSFILGSPTRRIGCFFSTVESLFLVRTGMPALVPGTSGEGSVLSVLQ